MRKLRLVVAAVFVATAFFVGTVTADPSASMTFTPRVSTPSASGNFTATTTAGGVTACSVRGEETGTTGSGRGEADDGMSASGAISGLPNGHTARWVINFSADMRTEVGVLNYQAGSGGYSAAAWAGAQIICSSGSPSIFVDDAQVNLVNESHDTRSEHAILSSVGWTLNQSTLAFNYDLATLGIAESSRGEVTATAWATNWNACSGTAVAYDVNGTPIMIQSFPFE